MQHATRAPKKQRLTVYLISGDDTLWPLIGADLGGEFVLKQLDTVAELAASAPPGDRGIVLWDARGYGETAGLPAALRPHTAGFVIVVLDSNGREGFWTRVLQQRQFAALVGLPVSSVALSKALDSAREELQARLAPCDASPHAPSNPRAAENSGRPTRWLPLAIVGSIAAAGVLVFVINRHGSSPARSPALGKEAASGELTVTASQPAVSADEVQAVDEQVDALLAKARQAMGDRHFIDPAPDSALALYREVLRLDAGNGEARQGMQRLSQISIARIQPALDQRNVDVASRSLETARSIDPTDPRLPALYDRLSGVRAREDGTKR